MAVYWGLRSSGSRITLQRVGIVVTIHAVFFAEMVSSDAANKGIPKFKRPLVGQVLVFLDIKKPVGQRFCQLVILFFVRIRPIRRALARLDLNTGQGIDIPFADVDGNRQLLPHGKGLQVPRRPLSRTVIKCLVIDAFKPKLLR